MTHSLAESGMVEPLVTLWQETTQAHFLHALAVPEALVVLRERRERVHSLLPSSSETGRPLEGKSSGERV